jgi:hypothetical protein
LLSPQLIRRGAIFPQVFGGWNSSRVCAGVDYFGGVALTALLAYYQLLQLVTGIGISFYKVVQGPYISSAILGCGFICLAGLERRRVLSVLCVATAGSLVAYGIIPHKFISYLQAFGYGLATAAVLVQGLLLAFDLRRGDWGRSRILARAALLLSGTILGGMEDDALKQLNPTYDAAMFNFDQSLGLRIPVLLMTALDSMPPLKTLVFLTYHNIPAVIGAFDIAYRANSPRLAMTPVFLISGFVGYFCYHLVPVAGPPFLDPTYMGRLFSDAVQLPVGHSVLPPTDPRSSVPSLHSTWGFFFLLNLATLRNPAERAIFAVLATFTVVGALTAGMHWFLDIVIAVPFAIGLNALTGRFVMTSGRRLYLPALWCGAIVAAWFVLIRQSSFVDLPAIAAWGLVFATLAASAALLQASGQLGPISNVVLPVRVAAA